MTIGQKIRRLLAELGPARLMLTVGMLLIALLAARFSWNVILVGDAERALYDLRETYLAPRVDQDPRIVKVVYTDDTLIDTQKRSPLDRAMLARALANLDGMGAKAIGIDILIDQPQDEDPALSASLRAMQTPTFLAYANIETNRDNIRQRQQAFLDKFMHDLEGSKTRPASIRVETDIDNVVRSWPFIPPNLPPILSRAMAPDHNALRGYTGSIAFRLPKFVDRPVFASLPIDLLADPDLAPAFTEQVAGRYVLIGGDIVDVDQFETPLRLQTAQSMIGLDVHAHMLAQLLDAKRLPKVSQIGIWAVAFLVVLAGGLTSLIMSGVRTTLAIIVQMLFFGGLPYVLHGQGFDTQKLPAFGWIIGWGLAFAAVGMAAREVSSEQRRFAQSALGKYLPRDIAKEILDQPDRLALHGEKRDIFVVFTDLEGFTAMSHRIEPEMVATLLNGYLDKMCSVILKYGGTIDKFVGDATVSFWGAPISRPDDGERAARAAYELWQVGEDFRQSIPEGGPKIGKTRVGLHYGDAVIGNFGGEGRIQYTALGDSMNTASRLESANKQTGTAIIASREAVERSGLDWWRPLGRVRLRGREEPVEIFEPCPDSAAGDNQKIAAILSLAERDRTTAVQQLDEFVQSKPDDMALQKLLYRMKNLDPGGFYALD
ncbi:MAG: adenylate/guanylate cyclase domain-containing protein [Sphingomonadaceae bacterium]|nr:adenylate/guanylate cyclase domain-containing protein [Sphingomonadaceae bacterium]